MRRTILLLCLIGLVAVPALDAASPGATTPKNAAQWCNAWRAGEQAERFSALFPGNLGFAQTFESKRGNGLTKTNLFGRCVSLTAKKLAAAKAAAAAETSVSSRCKADLARPGSAYTNVGRCVSDGGARVRP